MEKHGVPKLIINGKFINGSPFVLYFPRALSDDEYYDQTPMRQQQRQLMEQSWLPGQYENFEVRWVGREPYHPQMHNDGYGPAGGGRYQPRYTDPPRVSNFSRFCRFKRIESNSKYNKLKWEIESLGCFYGNIDKRVANM